MTTEAARPVITRDVIVSFIKANEHRSNPGATLPLRFGQNGACAYFEFDQLKDADVPSCVIGNVLAQFGITPVVHRIPNESACAVFRYLEDVLDIAFEDGVDDFATLIQGFADRGYTWGTALELALLKEASPELFEYPVAF
jgi:hypothetical protein